MIKNSYFKKSFYKLLKLPIYYKWEKKIKQFYLQSLFKLDINVWKNYYYLKSEKNSPTKMGLNLLTFRFENYSVLKVFVKIETIFQSSKLNYLLRILATTFCCYCIV